MIEGPCKMIGGDQSGAEISPRCGAAAAAEAPSRWCLYARRCARNSFLLVSQEVLSWRDVKENRWRLARRLAEALFLASVRARPGSTARALEGVISRSRTLPNWALRIRLKLCSTRERWHAVARLIAELDSMLKPVLKGLLAANRGLSGLKTQLF
ncbi:hypothetical protein MTO96_051029 [Rhipicephalus appendiculatus]